MSGHVNREFPGDDLSEAILAGIILVGRLGVASMQIVIIVSTTIIIMIITIIVYSMITIHITISGVLVGLRVSAYCLRGDGVASDRLLDATV